MSYPESIQSYSGGILPGNRITQPYYPRAIWQLSSRVLADEDKTNNFAESHNNRLQQAVRIPHPDLPRFLHELKVRSYDLSFL